MRGVSGWVRGVGERVGERDGWVSGWVRGVGERVGERGAVYTWLITTPLLVPNLGFHHYPPPQVYLLCTAPMPCPPGHGVPCPPGHGMPCSSLPCEYPTCRSRTYSTYVGSDCR